MPERKPTDRTENDKHLVLPEKLPENGVLVGWSLEREHVRSPLGFQIGDPDCCPEEGFVAPVLFESGGHLMTIAPTGAGKGTGCIIPALLRHQGPAVVFDPKGEAYAVTARRRRELGQRVVLLDPMGITGDESDSFNPLDLIDPDQASAADDAAALADLIVDRRPGEGGDGYVMGRVAQLLAGLLLHLAYDYAPEKRTLVQVRQLLSAPESNFKPLVEAMRQSRSPEVREVAGMFALMPEQALGPVLATAQEQVSIVRNPVVEGATARSNFPLDAVLRGDPLSIYVVVPPANFVSHSRLLRLWIGGLMMLTARRLRRPDRATLFLLDEAATLGSLPQLRQAVIHMQDYGIQTWSFWQDVSHLQYLYPMDWRAMVNNCRVQQAFGATNMVAAQEIAGLSGFGRPYEIIDLDAEEMILLIGGDEAVVALRPNYLRDPAFQGLFDPNPFHMGTGRIAPLRTAPKRLYERPPPPKEPILPVLDPVVLNRLMALSRGGDA